VTLAPDDEERVRERLLAAGIDEAGVRAASEAGRLGTLAVDVALGGLSGHSLSAVAREARLPVPYVRTLLQAIGRPNPARGERAFTNEDVELARIARALEDAGLPRDGIVEAARVIGHTTAQMAESLRVLVGDALIEPGDTDAALGARYARAVDEMVPIVPPLLGLALRAHLRDGIRREMVTQAEREAGRLDDTREIAVGFADLVGYTALGYELSSPELGSVAGRYGRLAAEAAQQPVRLVKLLGDGAMFVSPDPARLVATLVDLRRRVEEAKPALPRLRIGVAHGAATSRGGDWFGAPVNLASRIADEAKSGQLVATEELVAAVPDGEWKRRRKRSLKGVDGRVRLYSLESA
jgi:adenylate cyclase